MMERNFVAIFPVSLKCLLQSGEMLLGDKIALEIYYKLTIKAMCIQINAHYFYQEVIKIMEGARIDAKAFIIHCLMQMMFS